MGVLLTGLAGHGGTFHGCANWSINVSHHDISCRIQSHGLKNWKQVAKHAPGPGWLAGVLQSNSLEYIEEENSDNLSTRTKSQVRRRGPEGIAVSVPRLTASFFVTAET